jgi:glycine betaine catabolism B
MESHIVKIISIKEVTHNVKSFRLEKPEGYQFVPGQATEVSIHKKGWENEKRPFTFTSLNDDTWLEFTIKGYADHPGVTHQLHHLSPGDELVIRDVWGAIEYKGPGYFIAGGAGITPFIAIFRQLHKDDRVRDNTLFFSNKTAKDIIYEDEFKGMLGDKAHFILTKHEKAGYDSGYIDKRFLEKNIRDFSKNFYICGPEKMISDINNSLTELGAKPDVVVFEK